MQLYSLATPNGVKVTVMLEELVELSDTFEYDAFPINIGKGEQFGSGFVSVNPNSKIPCLLDHTPEATGGKAVPVFESAAILVYLAETVPGAQRFLPTEEPARSQCISWVMWQMGSGPYLGGGFGHFFSYAPVKIRYAIDRFSMETKRQLDVLNRQLAGQKYICGDTYTIADMAIWPW